MPRPSVTTTSRAGLQALGNGRYELCEFVSKGGMGAVYRARDTELDRWVAVKCLLDVAKEGSRDLAIKEARTLASLSHPNIMRVFDILTIGDQVWIVSEWLDGKSLAQLPLPLPPGCVLAIMAQVYDALAAAHTAQIVHRDIKPSNVMIRNDGRISLIDFGVAFAPGSSTGETLAGSLRYTDPRILEGEPPDALSDLFSAALLQVELMTGETVLPDLAPLPLYRHIKKNLDARLDQLLDGAYPPLTALARKFTGRLRTDPELTQVEPAAAREAAILSHEILGKLTRKPPDQYLASGLCRGAIVDPVSDRIIADETSAALTSTMLTPKQKAAWIAFKASGEPRSARRQGTRTKAKPAVAPRNQGHADRRAHLLAEMTRRRHFAFSVGLATFVLASLILWARAASWSIRPPVDQLPLVDRPAGAEATDDLLGPERATKLGGAPAAYADRSIGVGGSETPPAPTPPATSAPMATDDPTTEIAQEGLLPVYLVANAWADVVLDGKAVGRLPQAAPFLLAPGRHALMLSSPSVEPFATEITVEPGKATRLHFELKPRTTPRKVRLSKPGRLFIDGVDHGVVTEKTLTLSYGTHRVWVKRLGRKGKAKDIALGPESPAEIVIE